MTRLPTKGVSLLNTLVVVAIGAGFLQTMLSSQDAALSSLKDARDVAQADSLASAGATSVASALKRDFVEAPEMDHLNEAWAEAEQSAIDLDFGRFEVTVKDAQARIDLNALAPANLAQQRLLENLLTALDLPQVLGPRIAQIVVQNGPLLHSDELSGFGLAQADMDRLMPHVTTLNRKGTININTAEETVLAALFGDDIVAQVLVSRRRAKGFLEPDDLASVGVVLPNLGGFKSDTFDVLITAEVGLAKVTLHRRLLRDPDTGTVEIFPLR